MIPIPIGSGHAVSDRRLSIPSNVLEEKGSVSRA
jgi:hypothetical protein